MSWNKEVAGPPKHGDVPCGVIEAVKTDASIPEVVKECVEKLVAALGDAHGVHVKTHGHIGPGSEYPGNNVTIEIRQVEIRQG